MIKKESEDNLISFDDRVDKGEEVDVIFLKFGEVDILSTTTYWKLSLGHSTKYFIRELTLKQTSTTNPYFATNKLICWL